MSNENLLEKLNGFFTSIWNWVKGAEKTAEIIIPEVEHKILSASDAIGNELKVLEGSDLVQFLEKQVFVIIESVDPALKPFFDGLGLELQKIITVTANASADLSGEADKTLEQQAIDGLNAIKNLKGVKDTSYASKLAEIVTGISDFGLSNNAVETGVVSPGAATLLALGQAIHITASLPQEPAIQETDPDMQISNEAAENLANSGQENPPEAATPPEEPTQATPDKQMSYDEAVTADNNKAQGSDAKPDDNPPA